MTREDFIKKRRYLFWYVKNPEKVNDEALVEAVLNLGNWDDVQKLIKLIGIQQVAKIFREQVGAKRIRTNYSLMTKNYFNLYFDKHCPEEKKQDRNKKIPSFMHSALWSYDISKFDPESESDKRIIIEQVLNHGNWNQLEWVLRTYKEKEIREILLTPSRGTWMKDAMNYWVRIFNLKITKAQKEKALFHLEPKLS